MWKVSREDTVCEEIKKEFWKCIGFIILEVVYSNKWCRIWVKTHESNHGKVKGQIQRGVNRKKIKLKVSCYLYYFNYCYFRHWTMLYYTNLFIYCMFLWVLTYQLYRVLVCTTQAYRSSVTSGHIKFSLHQ